MTTFEDVERKYNESLTAMRIGSEITSDSFTQSNPWIHKPTLARWLYGSGQEFLRDYKDVSGKLTKINGEHNLQVSLWLSELTHNLEQFRTEIRNRFPHDFLLMAATKAEEKQEATK